MLRLLIEKELSELINSKKFLWLSVTSGLLILISVYLGIQQYETAREHQHISDQLSYQMQQQETSYGSLSKIVHRDTPALLPFIKGVHGNIGRRAVVSRYGSGNLLRSPYADHPIYALFGTLDLSIVVQLVLTLFALLLTYDSVTRERERGTLKLLFSNDLPRVTFVFGKWIGISAGLLLVLIIPFLLGLLMIQLAEIPLSGPEWLRLIQFGFASALLLLVFTALGVMVSSFSTKGSYSFVSLLMIWIIFALILPRTSVMTAGSFIDATTQTEIDGLVSAREQELRGTYQKDLVTRWEERGRILDELPEEEHDSKRDELQESWMQEDEQARLDMRKNIQEYRIKVREEADNEQAYRERAGLLMAQLSPVAAYQILGMNLASVDVRLKRRYQERINRFKADFDAYTAEMQAKSKQPSGINIMISQEDGVKITMNRDRTLELSGMPEFQHPNHRPALSSVAVSWGSMIFYLMLTLGGAMTGVFRMEIG